MTFLDTNSPCGRAFAAYIGAMASNMIDIHTGSESRTQTSLGFETTPQDTRVVVAMSGGVDSSAVAALLSAAQYDVVGITLQLYDHGAALAKKGACCAGQDIHDARRVAESLDMPHYVLDYESRFQQSVMEDFADSYLAGETPIPCIRCNERVKFRDLLDTARDLGAEALVTGHYVRRVMGPEGAEMHRARDHDRDQSYFLFTTTQEQLDYLRFPLGDLTKDETRQLAEDFDLPVAAKPDSQDICFVPQGRYTSVIEKLRPGAAEPGDIVHLDGRVLGQHDGIIKYTIGQRRHLGVATGEPLYVVGLDADKKRVIVGPKEALLTTDIRVKEVNWLGGPTLHQQAQNGLEVQVKVRSTKEPMPATLYLEDGNRALVVLDDGEEGVSPGQACVFYDREAGSRVLGGGWIAEGTRITVAD